MYQICRHAGVLKDLLVLWTQVKGIPVELREHVVSHTLSSFRNVPDTVHQYSLQQLNALLSSGNNLERKHLAKLFVIQIMPLQRARPGRSGEDSEKDKRPRGGQL